MIQISRRERHSDVSRTVLKPQIAGQELGGGTNQFRAFPSVLHEVKIPQFLEHRVNRGFADLSDHFIRNFYFGHAVSADNG